MPPRKKQYRIAQPGQHILTDPESGEMVVPNPHENYPSDHRLVKKYPQLFRSDEDIIESASAGPGEKRSISGLLDRAEED